MRKSFRFKQFEISDTGCAMKLGTDAVLLGSWVCPPDKGKILDIGCGCGILSLMMAQKSKAWITGIEIHPPSAQRAGINSVHSPWGERINIVEDSFQHYVVTSPERFNLIISNPPYYENSLKAPSQERRLSRHNDSLNSQDLLSGVEVMLDTEGVFALILPQISSESFIHQAYIRGLYLKRKLNVRPGPGKPIIRCCLDFGKHVTIPEITEITIRNSDNTYSDDYIILTRDFYL